jgi:hypothetical protein
VGPVDTHRWLAEGSCVIARQLDGAVLLIYAEDEATATAILDAIER